MKKTVMIGALALALLLCICSAGCIFSVPTVSTTVTDANEMGITFDLSKEEFETAGFSPGDIVNVSFSSGVTENLVPYVEGSFFRLINMTKVSEGMNDSIALSIRETAEENPETAAGETVTITRAVPQGAIVLQTLGSLGYTDDRDKYPSDEVFANFRAVNAGNLRENLIYRGASPVDNQHLRAAAVDKLIENAGIKTDLDLSDTEESLTRHMNAADFNSPYFKSLYDSGKVIVSGIGINYAQDATKKTLADSFTAMSETEGPYYIHCIEGKDRTGLVCLMLESLADATTGEMADDFMKTYENYYGVEKDSLQYTLIKSLKFDDMVDLLTKNGKLTLKEGVKQYLREGGMTDGQIDRLITKITK